MNSILTFVLANAFQGAMDKMGQYAVTVFNGMAIIFILWGIYRVFKGYMTGDGTAQGALIQVMIGIVIFAGANMFIGDILALFGKSVPNLPK